MGDLFVVDVGGDDCWAQRQADERRRLRARYLQRIVDEVPLDPRAAERVVALLLDHPLGEDKECLCGCHPHLSSLHDDGFDCPCTWGAGRRAVEHEQWLASFDGPEFDALREEEAAEEAEIAGWLAGQVGVTAIRKSSFAPEQWEGAIDGHTFYFRERHDEWRIEVDLEPSGEFANRVVEVTDDGELVTEPVPIEQGEVITRGLGSQLGETAVDHADFIVRAVRQYLWRRQCDHFGALLFCPTCGVEMPGPTLG